MLVFIVSDVAKVGGFWLAAIKSTLAAKYDKVFIINEL